MAGLFGTLNLGTRALQTQQKGAEVAGHNLANINNSAYARQRVVLETSSAVQTSEGWLGTGVQATAIIGLRDGLLDRQITTESSVSGSLTAQQEALSDLEARVGARLQSVSTTDGAADSLTGLEASLVSLFTSFQAVAGSPTSLTTRQDLLNQADELATDLQAADRNVATAQASMDDQIRENVTQANRLLADIAALNGRIQQAESGAAGSALDLRDTRQQHLEELAEIVRVEAVESADGQLDVSVGGALLVSGGQTLTTLDTVTGQSGHLDVVAQNAPGQSLTLTGGAIHGLITVRDGAAQSFRDDLNTLASTLITEVNRIHGAGYGLDGTTGTDFFQGQDASDISVNSALTPAGIQASSVAGETGNNSVIQALAGLASASQSALDGLSFTESYHTTVSDLGQAISDVESDVADQEVVRNMLDEQRTSVSGVSMDEELVDLMLYQKAFAASARVVSTVAEMLDTVINLKR